MYIILIDVHGVIFPSNRNLFAIGESVTLRCNTTPSDLPVIWERNTANGFVNLANDSSAIFSPANSKTNVTLPNIMLSDAGGYVCFGAAPQFVGMRGVIHDIIVVTG